MEDAEKEEESGEDEGEDDEANPLNTNEPLVSGSLAATLQFLKNRGTSMPFEAYHMIFKQQQNAFFIIYSTLCRYTGRVNDKIMNKNDGESNVSC